MFIYPHIVPVFPNVHANRQACGLLAREVILYSLPHICFPKMFKGSVFSLNNRSGLVFFREIQHNPVFYHSMSRDFQVN